MYILHAFTQALHLLKIGDPSTYSAIGVSIKASFCSLGISLLLGIPFGFCLGYSNFFGKKLIKTMMNATLAFPTVVIGLLVYTLICHHGIFSRFNLLFSIKAIIIGQSLLALPIIIALTTQAVEGIDHELRLLVLTLGANRRQLACTLLYESRYALFAAAALAYGRVFSELGISMMLGGNIKWYTRTITTAIAFETDKGEFALGIALGLVLLMIAWIVNVIIYLCREKL